MFCYPDCKLLPQGRQRLLAGAAAQPAQRACQAPLLQARHANALADAFLHLWQREALTYLCHDQVLAFSKMCRRKGVKRLHSYTTSKVVQFSDMCQW